MMRGQRFSCLVLLTLLCRLGAPVWADPPARGPLPRLEPGSREPIDLLFTEPASLLKIYRAIGSAFGFDIVFDPKLRDQQTALELEGVTAEQALDFLMTRHGHFYVVLDPRSILIADDTPQNRRTYETLTIQIFPLENVDVKDVMTLVRSLLGTKNIAAMEMSNSIVVRDSAERTAVVAELLRILDQPQAEVEIGVEVLEVNTRKLEGFLADLSQRRGVPVAGAAGLRLTPGELAELHRATRPQSLAHPSVSVRDGKEGQLELGELIALEPACPQGQTGSETPPSRQKIGFELRLKPMAHPRSGEVSLDLVLLVRSLVGDSVVAPGVRPPTIATRQLSSSQRLGSGESYLIAGLTETGGPESAPTSPGSVSRLGRLFAPADGKKETEIVIAVTLRVVRGPVFTDQDLQPLVVGTEMNIALSEQTPAEPAAPTSGPMTQDEERAAVQKRLRERLRSLSVGLEPDPAPEPVKPDGD